MKRLFPLLLISLILLFSSVITVNAESEFEVYLIDFYPFKPKERIIKEKLFLKHCANQLQQKGIQQNLEIYTLHTHMQLVLVTLLLW